MLAKAQGKLSPLRIYLFQHTWISLLLILSNTLELNGGTTFILRLCRELRHRGVDVGVLVLIGQINEGLRSEIEKYASLYFLKDYIRFFKNVSFRTQAGIFLPQDDSALVKLAERYGSHLHSMGVFGLLFAANLARCSRNGLKISAGIYHQNEFMFRDVDYFFAKESKRIFASLAPENIVFFNEENVESYSRFFNQSFSSAHVVPIGIDLPLLDKATAGSPFSRKIVSVGNLVNFKSYNENIIRLMPELLALDANFTYHIYGTGNNEQVLREIVTSLGLKNQVEFCGRIDYRNFRSVLQDAFLFVGSGTSILEASAMGVPSIVGIESMKTPDTYGYLSDIKGYSYNEFLPGRRLFRIFDKIYCLFKSGTAEKWIEIATSCKAKAETFSINRTADGFQKLALLVSEFDCYSDTWNVHRELLSILFCGFCNKIGIDTIFINRRNQGSINC